MAGVNVIPVSHAGLSSPLGDNYTTNPCLYTPDLTLWSTHPPGSLDSGLTTDLLLRALRRSELEL